MKVKIGRYVELVGYAVIIAAAIAESRNAPVVATLVTALAVLIAGRVLQSAQS